MSAFMATLTYEQFLALFLLPPIAGLIILTLRDRRRRGANLADARTGHQPMVAVDWPCSRGDCLYRPVGQSSDRDWRVDI